MIGQESLRGYNLAAYTLQVAVVVMVGSLLLFLLRLEIPKIRLAYWQALVAACVVLPLINPGDPSGRREGPMRSAD